MDLHLNGKSVLVTGASRGIGLACALSFAEEGCDVVLVARDAERLRHAGTEVEKVAQRSVTTHVSDLSQTREVIDMVDRFAYCDILVNNAGDVTPGSIEDVDGDAWRAGWEAKVFGYIDATREMLVHMYARRSGVIVNIIGVGGVQHSYGYVAGSTANAGLMAFTDAIGSHSVDFGVRVVGVNPGAVDTDRYRAGRATAGERERSGGQSRGSKYLLDDDLPFGRVARPAEVADVVAFLASDRAAYVSGTVVTVDGGRTFR